MQAIEIRTDNAEQSGGDQQQLRTLIETGNFVMKGLAHFLSLASRTNIDLPTQLATTEAQATPVPDDPAVESARRVYHKRRERERIFGASDIFGEPAWDMLVDLFIAGETNKPVSVTSACIAAAVPATTALRWLGLLEERNMVIRIGDRNDARRTFVVLSADAHESMRRYFS